MIARSKAEALLALVREDPSLEPEAVAAFLKTQPCFQNTAYPFALNPLLVASERVEGIRVDVESYVRLLEKVVRLYRQDPEVRAFFALGTVAERLIAAEGMPRRSIRICRLDGYLTGDGATLRILENNADAPAGTLFTPRLNQIVRHLLGARLDGTRAVLPMDSADPFSEALIGAYHEGGGLADRPSVGILQLEGKSNRESEELARELQSRGVPAQVVDPRQVERSGAGWMAAGRRVELIWNKINTVAWNGLMRESPELVDRWEALLREGTPVHVNGFGARCVAEAKTCLAWLHAPAFQGHLTAEERALVAARVPWTARLDPGAEVTFDGERMSLRALLTNRQAELVLKQQYDIRGDGVTIGRSTPPEVWLQTAEAIAGTGAVVQRYVPPATYPVVLAREGRRAEELKVSLDSFVFDGRLVGFGAKASANDRVNLFQGGSKLSVIVACS